MTLLRFLVTTREISTSLSKLYEGAASAEPAVHVHVAYVRALLLCEQGDILSAAGDPSRYKEIVFCGYGEPTLRLDAIKAVASEIKKHRAKIRVVTNGHGDLINKRAIAPELKGLVDSFSVSLNTDTEKVYNEMCKPEFGSSSYGAIREFIKSAVKLGLDVEVTCLDLPGVDTAKCEEIAKSAGARFRLRRYGVTG